jgi:predicted deacylase
MNDQSPSSATMGVAVFDGVEPGPRVLITAGIHGDEFEPIVAVRQLQVVLRNEAIRGRVTLIPIANPSAFNRGLRTAEDDLDLARVFPGSPTGSITHQTAFELSERIRQADYYLDLHTGGTRLQLLPLAGYMLHSDPRVLAKQRAMAEAFQLPLIWGTSAELQGRSLSVARDANVPAIYVEHGGGGSFDFSIVESYLRGCLNVLAMLGVIERQVDCRCTPTYVEERHSNSGHLQVCHPAPHNGLFMPCVQLGQVVDQGDPLGTVFNVSKNIETPIPAEHAGIVLMLHTSPSVSEGTGLAVVLQTNPRLRSSE